VGVSKFSNLGLPQLWGPIILCADLRSRWGPKQSCSPCWELSNGMLHITCTRGNWGDSWLLVVESQIANLTPSPSFGHNLCFRCPNGSCKPTSNIYVPRAFQWYKEHFNLMSFDPCNRPLKIQESIGTPTPKMGVHSFVFSGAWNVTLQLTLGPHPCKPLLWSQTQG